MKKYLDDDRKCPLKIVDVHLYDDFLYLPFENGSTLKNKFEVVTRRIAESGIPKHWPYLDHKYVNFYKGSLFDI